MSTQRLDIAFPIYDSIAPAHDLLTIVSDLEAADFNLQVRDALAAFPNSTEPTTEDYALADTFDDEPCDSVIDEQITAGKAWAITLAASVVAASGICLWAVTA